MASVVIHATQVSLPGKTLTRESTRDLQMVGTFERMKLFQGVCGSQFTLDDWTREICSESSTCQRGSFNKSTGTHTKQLGSDGEAPHTTTQVHQSNPGKLIFWGVCHSQCVLAKEAVVYFILGTNQVINGVLPIEVVRGTKDRENLAR